MYHQIISYFALLNRRARLEFAALLIPMLLISLFELLSIALIVPFLELALHPPAGSGGMTHDALRFLTILIDPSRDSLIYAGGLLIGVFAFKNFCIFVLNYLIYLVTLRNKAKFDVELFQRFLGTPLETHLSRNSSEAVRDFVTSVGVVFEAIRTILSTVLEVLLMTVVFGLLLVVETNTAIGSAILIGAFSYVLYLILGPRAQKWGHEIWADEAAVIKSINEASDAIREIKVFGCAITLRGDFSRIMFRLASTRTKIGAANQIPKLALESLVVGGFIVVVLLFREAGRSPEEIVNLIGLFGIAALRLMPSANRLVGNLNTIRRATPFLANIRAAQEFRDERNESSTTTGTVEAAIPFKNSIELRGVTYRYPNSDLRAVNDVSLPINRGQFIGLIGASGAGKSTLVDIILGLLRPTEGDILVDGSVIDARGNAWREKVAYVPQNICILDDSVARNIAFGVPGDVIDEAKIRATLKSVGLDDLLGSWPDGLETMLGERGSLLSGGQRQRIGIARALYRDPELLVLDEPTSALDSGSEQLVKSTLQNLVGEKTVVVIAHRLSTVRSADHLVLMDQGRVVEEGGFDELLQRSHLFRDMVAQGNTGPLEGGIPD